jgi:hypothetical protein
MSVTQLYALSAPALLGVLAIGFGLFELHRIRRMKASFAAPAVTGVQDSASDQVSGTISETPQSTRGLRVFGSEFILEDIPEAELELSKAMDKIATAHDQLAEAKHKLNKAVDKIAQATTAPQEKTGS